MQILYPKPPADPSIPQFWVFSLEMNSRLKSLSLLWRLGPIAIHWQRNNPDIRSTMRYARPSRFYVIRLNHADKNSGLVAKILKLVCMDCGLEYPCPSNLDTAMLCDCTVTRKSSVMLWWNRNKQPKLSDLLYRSSHEFML